MNQLQTKQRESVTNKTTWENYKQNNVNLLKTKQHQPISLYVGFRCYTVSFLSRSYYTHPGTMCSRLLLCTMKGYYELLNSKMVMW